VVREAVEAEPVPPVDAKGKSNALAAFRLRAVLPDVPGRVRRGDAPMVGRATELRRLRAAFEQARSDRSCQLFTVLGAAGVGKSRLVHGFLDALEGETEVLSGRCLPYGEGITFWPLAEVLKQAAGLDDSESPDQAVSRLARLARGADDADALATQTAGLLGIAD